MQNLETVERFKRYDRKAAEMEGTYIYIYIYIYLSIYLSLSLSIYIYIYIYIYVYHPEVGTLPGGGGAARCTASDWKKGLWLSALSTSRPDGNCWVRPEPILIGKGWISPRQGRPTNLNLERFEVKLFFLFEGKTRVRWKNWVVAPGTLRLAARAPECRLRSSVAIITNSYYY